MPTELSTLATLMRLAFRFRWEVLKKFGERELDDGDIARLEHALTDIEADSESRGVVDQNAVVYEGPGKEYSEVTRLNKGVEVKVLRKDGDWIESKSGRFEEGWIHISSGIDI
jgi:hypothetical protein